MRYAAHNWDVVVGYQLYNYSELKLKWRRIATGMLAHGRDDHMQGERIPLIARQMGAQMTGCMLQLLEWQQVVQIDDTCRVRKVFGTLYDGTNVRYFGLHAHNEHGNLGGEYMNRYIRYILHYHCPTLKRSSPIF